MAEFISDLSRYGWNLFAVGLNKFQTLCLWLLVVGLIFIALERLWWRHRQPVLRAGMREDLAFYFIGGLIPPAVGALTAAACLGLSAWLLPRAWFDWLASWPLALTIVGLMVLGEITYYWAHRLSHEIPWLWRFHSLHHSPTEMDWLVNTRAHPLDLIITHVISGMPLLLLGLKQPDSASVGQLVFAVVIFNVFWAFFVHSNCRLRFGFFEHVLTTPAFHHWHHTNDGPAFVNKNYSALFPWVDRIFGTHHLPAHYPERYGIPEPLPEGVGALLRYPFARRAETIQPSSGSASAGSP